MTLIGYFFGEGCGECVENLKYRGVSKVEIKVCPVKNFYEIRVKELERRIKFGREYSFPSFFYSRISRNLISGIEIPKRMNKVEAILKSNELVFSCKRESIEVIFFSQ